MSKLGYHTEENSGNTDLFKEINSSDLPFTMSFNDKLYFEAQQPITKARIYSNVQLNF